MNLWMKIVLLLAAIAEGLTGLVALAAPSFVTRLLLGSEVTGISVALTRLAGAALIGLGVACLPMEGLRGRAAGMAVYSALAALYLAVLGLGSEWSGRLLWPAAAIHALIALLLLRSLFGSSRAAAAK